MLATVFPFLSYKIRIVFLCSTSGCQQCRWVCLWVRACLWRNGVKVLLHEIRHPDSLHMRQSHVQSRDVAKSGLPVASKTRRPQHNTFAACTACHSQSSVWALSPAACACALS